MILSGNDSILFLRLQGQLVPIGCLTENSFSEETQMLPTTTRQTNGWATARANNQNYSISFAGLQVFTVLGGVGLLSLDRLQILKRNRTLVLWEEVRGNNLVQRGRGYIIQLDAENPVNQDALFSGVIQGFGAPELVLEGTILSDGIGNGVEDGLGNGITP
jgi:hypothetical protein